MTTPLEPGLGFAIREGGRTVGAGTVDQPAGLSRHQVKPGLRLRDPEPQTGALLSPPALVHEHATRASWLIGRLVTNPARRHGGGGHGGGKHKPAGVQQHLGRSGTTPGAAWRRPLRQLVLAGAQHRQVGELDEAIHKLLDLLGPIERFWAFPGTPAFQKLRRLFTAGKYDRFAVLVRGINRALATDSYRNGHAWDLGAKDDALDRDHHPMEYGRSRPPVLRDPGRRGHDRASGARAPRGTAPLAPPRTTRSSTRSSSCPASRTRSWPRG